MSSKLTVSSKEHYNNNVLHCCYGIGTVTSFLDLNPYSSEHSWVNFPPNFIFLKSYKCPTRIIIFKRNFSVFKLDAHNFLQQHWGKTLELYIYLARSLSKTNKKYHLLLDCSSVTRWLDYFSIFGHFQQWKLAQNCHKFAKVGSAFCQIRNELSKICQSGEILPNLVKLGHCSLLNWTPLAETSTNTLVLINVLRLFRITRFRGLRFWLNKNRIAVL